jgi:hypothetical protein
MSFFCEFLLNEKSEVKFFWLKRNALKRGIYDRLNVFHGVFEKFLVANPNEIGY